MSFKHYAIHALLTIAAVAITASGQVTPEGTDGVSESAVDWRGNDTCAVCHQDSKYTHRYPEIEIGSGDIDSTVHKSFACVDCHYDGFDDYPHNKIVHRSSCADCHEDQHAEYEISVHAEARARGDLDAPACTDCHGFHDIQSPREQLSGQSAVDMCSQCHADESLTSKFKLKPTVLEGFSTSYHGQMYGLGFDGTDYATCVSCHSNHAILGKDHPQSTIAAVNIVETCKECHSDANESFAGYLTHWTPDDGESKVLDGTFHFMEILIWSVMIIFGAHSILWFLHSTMTMRLPGRNDKKPQIDGDPQVTVARFNPVARIMHIILVISFMTLAATGLPVKFSEAGFSQWIAQNLVGFSTAALIHRIAGVTLLTLFIVHVFHVLYQVVMQKKKGFFWGPDSLVPNHIDVIQFFQNIAYFLFLRKTPPKFDRWTYWEKFDYFAVFWGMAIIGLSGLALMLPLVVTQIVPGWMLNFALIVHSEEALLATAFIFVVHFVNANLRPNVFPLDDVMFTGQMTLERFAEERPAEYQRLKDEGRLEERIVQTLPRWKVMIVRLVAFLLLLVGLTLLVLIIFGVSA